LKFPTKILYALVIFPVSTRNSHLTFRIHLITPPPPPPPPPPPLPFLIVDVEAVVFLPINLFHARRAACLELCVVSYLLFVSLTPFGGELILSYLSATAGAAATATTSATAVAIAAITAAAIM
jgi:hypothetical protein